MLAARTYELKEDAITPTQKKFMDREGYEIKYGNETNAVSAWFSNEMLIDHQRLYLLPVRAEDFALLPADPLALQSNRLFSLLPTEVISLGLKIGNNEVVFRRAQSTWQSSQGHDLTASQSTNLDRLVDSVCALDFLNPTDLPNNSETGVLTLSRSRNPIAKNGLAMKWWGGDGMAVLAANFDGGAAVPVNRQVHRIAVSALKY